MPTEKLRKRKKSTLIPIRTKIKDLDLMDNFDLYLQSLEKFNITPNFLCSHEYFTKAGYCGRSNSRYVGIYDTDDLLVLPLIDLLLGRIHSIIPYGGIWAGLPGFDPGYHPEHKKVFWDLQYIYNPKDFEDMSGKKWATFRKNSRKFLARYPYRTKWVNKISDDKIEDFANAAIMVIKDNSIHDVEVMITYLMEGKHRRFLINKSQKEILAINIWDQNYKYINYRYCLCLNIPFLSEYARLSFYKSIQDNRMVNDGGTLGRESLKSFKDKLNPIVVMKIYNWKRI